MFCRFVGFTLLLEIILARNFLKNKSLTIKNLKFKIMYTYYGNKVEQILDALDREELKNKSRILQIEITKKTKKLF